MNCTASLKITFSEYENMLGIKIVVTLKIEKLK